MSFLRALWDRLTTLWMDFEQNLWWLFSAIDGDTWHFDNDDEDEEEVAC